MRHFSKTIDSAVGWSVVCDVIVAFPGDTHLPAGAGLVQVLSRW